MRWERFSNPLSASEVELYWDTVSGYYLMVKKDSKGDLLAKTRSASTAARMTRLGFKGVDVGWRLYAKSLSDFATY